MDRLMEYRSATSSASEDEEEEDEWGGDDTSKTRRMMPPRRDHFADIDTEDSEAEFNMILELCRKKREYAVTKEREKLAHKDDGKEGSEPQHSGKATELEAEGKSKVAGSGAVGQHRQAKRPPRGKIFDEEYYSLPPVEDPSIHVEEDVELKRFGVVDRLVDFIVNVKPLPGVPHLDYDTMLFDSERNAVGEIFEVFGPVCDTMYALRFNSAEEAAARLPVGTELYYVAESEGNGPLTKVILATELMKMKISDPAGKHDCGDASGEDSDEPAFSNDEDEQLYLASRRPQKHRVKKVAHRSQPRSEENVQNVDNGAEPSRASRGGRGGPRGQRPQQRHTRGGGAFPAFNPQRGGPVNRGNFRGVARGGSHASRAQQQPAPIGTAWPPTYSAPTPLFSNGPRQASHWRAPPPFPPQQYQQQAQQQQQPNWAGYWQQQSSVSFFGASQQARPMAPTSASAHSPAGFGPHYPSMAGRGRPKQ